MKLMLTISWQLSVCLLAIPHAVIYGLRIGFPAAYRIGGRFVVVISNDHTGKLPIRGKAVIDSEVVDRNQEEELVDMSLLYGNRVDINCSERRWVFPLHLFDDDQNAL